jgi:hypothetical protein
VSDPPSAGDPDAPVDLDRYRAIRQLAELELELAGKGDLDDLQSLADGFHRLTADLPDQPPPAAQPLLEQAALLHERTRIELLRLREGLVSDLTSVGTVARAAHGYSPKGGGRSQLDRSA